MADPASPALPNPGRKIINRFLAIAIVFLVGAALAGGAVLAHGGFDASKDDTVGTVAVTALALCGSVSAAMFLSALLSVPAMRSTGRVLAEFSRGELLADWTFAPVEWDAFVTREGSRLAVSPWSLAVIFGPMAVIGCIACWSATTGWRAAATASALTLAAMGAAALLARAAFQVALRRRLDRLRRHPRALIGRNGLYCGDAFRLWGSNMIVLQSVRKVGNPAALQFITGTGAGVRAAGAALGAATLLAGGAYTGAASGMQWIAMVPIPEGKSAEADAVLRALLVPQPARMVPQPAGTSPAPAAVSPVPRVPRTPGTARSLWAIAGVEFFAGCVSMWVFAQIEPPPGQEASGWVALVAFVGEVLLAVGLVTAIVALFRSFKRRPANR